MKSFVSTVVGGTIGLIALYVVGRVAFQAGREVERAEQHYENVQRKTKEIAAKNDISEEPEEQTLDSEEGNPLKLTDKIGLIFGLKRRTSNNESVIGKLIHTPEAHRIEAFIEGDELKLNVKPKNA